MITLGVGWVGSVGIEMLLWGRGVDVEETHRCMFQQRNVSGDGVDDESACVVGADFFYV